MNKLLALSIPRLFATLLMWFTLAVFLPALATGEQGHDYFSMSMDELLNISVTAGSITGSPLSHVPASITIITSADIAATPARNILDLLEVYVPGATYVDHYLGPRLGLRGNLGDQNYSFLLIVDGQNMNLTTRIGPVYELLNRDLRDVESIEVIRGPGSVTYGPGAIAGIISITTKNAQTNPGLVAGVSGNLEYRYGQVDASYGYQGSDLNFHIYGSINSSKGQEDPQFYYIDRAHGYGYGFMGPDWGNQGLGTDPPPVMDDYRNRPQVKLDLKSSLGKTWRLHGRYTSNSWTKQIQATNSGPKFGGFNRANISFSLKNEIPTSAASGLTTTLAYYSGNYDDIQLYQGANQPLDDLTQKNAYFSENRWNLQSIWRFESDAGHRSALGASVEHQSWAAPWGKDDSSFILGLRAPIGFAVLDSSSAFYQQYPEFSTLLTEDISAIQTSIFGESNLILRHDLSLLLSGRGDKHEFAEWAWSPRVALIKSLGKNMIKAIWQKSVRLPAFEDLYSQHLLNEGPAKPEILQGLELIYHHRQIESWDFDVSTYFNRIDQIAWLREGHAGPVGTFDIFGLEMDAKYQTPKLILGSNYSYINQLDWETSHPIDAYIRIPDDPDEVHYPLPGFAENRINNLPRHALKMYLRMPLADRKLILHLDGRLFWSPGQADMLEMFKDVHEANGSPETQAEMNAIYDDLKEHGYAEPMFTTNLSLAWQVPVSRHEVWATLYANNLVTHNFQRYVIQYWEENYLRQYPRQVGFLSEPLSLAARVEFRF
jgi:outer membrane receptor protein involved in Fe transport